MISRFPTSLPEPPGPRLQLQKDSSMAQAAQLLAVQVAAAADDQSAGAGDFPLWLVPGAAACHSTGVVAGSQTKEKAGKHGE